MDAFITVSDAAGRVLFRRLASDDEVVGALHAAQVAREHSQLCMRQLEDEPSEFRRGRESIDAP